ncbi:MAG TPA: PIN domain-containing protein [Solirubrobacterales bacterium]|nr:PIN domain-containing protein [Solirubrobacterales bacterium]
MLDTGVIVAAFDRDDDHHEACSSLLANLRERRTVPSPVLVEVDHLLRRYTQDESFSAVLDQVQRGALVVEDLAATDYERAAELMRTYADLEVGFVDCAVLAITERLGEPKLATLDHRHFGTMRPQHVEALELLPPAS